MTSKIDLFLKSAADSFIVSEHYSAAGYQKKTGGNDETPRGKPDNLSEKGIVNFMEAPKDKGNTGNDRRLVFLVCSLPVLQEE